MPSTVTLSDPDALTQALVGGKGANLARTFQAGFPVPPAFVVTTESYRRFVADPALTSRIGEIVGAFDYDNPELLDKQAADLRSLITEVDLPAGLAGEIVAGYEALGADRFVAVRSSGTAEDLAEASFAGQHDTYLDIRGAAGVLDAVQRCWASLWTARAVAYRNSRGFSQGHAEIAVVVQGMVASEVSGVLFTGNPVTTATDESVIDASWGLGEAIVSGVVTPDQFVVKSRTLEIVERTVNTKDIRIVRDPAAGYDVVTEDVPGELRDVPSLTDEQVVKVADLGRRVQAYYDGLPQDIEWGLADGSIYLLQSRPITGVEFSWDADVEEPCWTNRISLYLRRRETEPIADHYDDVWTQEFGNAVNTGVMTPLTYSTRWPMYADEPWGAASDHLGSPELREIRACKYHKGTIYWNCRRERLWSQCAPPPFRPGTLQLTDPADHDRILSAPFDYVAYARQLVRMLAGEPARNGWGAIKWLEDHWRVAKLAETATPSAAHLDTLGDEELVRECERFITLDVEYNRYMGTNLLIYMRDAMSLLGLMVAKWYTGTNPNAFSELLAGSDNQSDTLKENHALWEFSERIRHSPLLLQAFRAHPGAAFFTELESSAEGQEFLAEYRVWAQGYAHRGHADRDMIYPRRSEDAGIDYRNFEIFLNIDNSVDPAKAERAANERREKTFQEVVDNLKRSGVPGLGVVKARAFTLIYKVVHDIMMARDNERQNPMDRITMGEKVCFLAMGRRLVERGVLQNADQVHYLAKHELYDVFLDQRRADTNPILLRAKIDARKRDIDRALADEIEYPMFLQRNRPLDRSGHEESSDGAIRGVGTSPGVVTGTARVVRKLSETGRVREGDIMITHHTDPGWTPVFLLLSGVVVETGGLLSHASSVAREYGFPAVQLRGAMTHIPDGATITVNGNTGEIEVQSQARV